MRKPHRQTPAVLLAMACLAHAALAAGPLSAIETSPAFDSAEAAVRAALALALQDARRREYAGAIIEHRGRFFYTEPVSNGWREETDIDVEVPAGARVVALFHTHVSSAMAEYFSAADIAAARRLGVKSYIGIAPSGRIRVFDPATMRPARVWKLERFGRISKGALLPGG